jgi:hypothetical protein
VSVSHEDIEGAYKPAVEVIAKLPDTTETREARRLVDISERLAHEARERTQPCADN